MDDSTYNLFVLKEMLEFINPDIELDTALNGEFAITKILKKWQNGQRGNNFYDLIFMDLNMPVLDGYQVSFFFLLFIYFRLDSKKTE